MITDLHLMVLYQKEKKIKINILAILFHHRLKCAEQIWAEFFYILIVLQLQEECCENHSYGTKLCT